MRSLSAKLAAPIVLLVVCCGLAVGVPSAAAADGGGTCTVGPADCYGGVQDVLAEDMPAQIEINANQLSIPGFDYVDPNSATGSDIFDYLLAQQDAGVAPGTAGIMDGFDATAGALDLGAASLAPETLGISVIGAITATYALKMLWGQWGTDVVTAQLNAPGSATGPRWVWDPNIGGGCFGNSGLGSGGYQLDWGANDGDWGAQWSTNGMPLDGTGTANCGIPLYTQTSFDPQVQADLHGMWDAWQQDANETECPNDAPQIFQTGTPGGVEWNTIYLTPAQMWGELTCVLQQDGPDTGSDTATVTVTAPAIDGADMPDAVNDPTPEDTVVINKALQEDGYDPGDNAGDPTGGTGTPTGTGGCPCSVHSLDFSGLAVTSPCGKFPFGVFCWMATVAGQIFGASPEPPSVTWASTTLAMPSPFHDVTLPGVTLDASQLPNAFFSWFVVLKACLSFLVWLIGLWYVGPRLLGLRGNLSSGDDGEEGDG